MLINYILLLLVAAAFGADIAAFLADAGLMPAALPAAVALLIAIGIGRAPLARMAIDRSRPAAALVVWCVDNVLAIVVIAAVVVTAYSLPLP